MDFDYRLLAKYLTDMLSPEEMKQVEEMCIRDSIIDGLTFTLQGAYVTNIKETKDYRKECWYDDVNYHGPDQLGETISRWSRYTLDALLNYDKTFNQDHHFKAMVGYKIEKYDYRNLYAFRKRCV